MTLFFNAINILALKNNLILPQLLFLCCDKALIILESVKFGLVVPEV